MQQLNLVGLKCPIPVLKTKKFLATLDSEQQVTVTTDDPASEKDLQEFCRKTGNHLIQQFNQDNLIITIIQRR
jgi:tRNA 2-thiouridine synthesizing protein A